MDALAAIIAGLVAAVVLAATILFCSLAGAAFGALTGWLVSLTPLGGMATAALHALRIDGVTLAQLGALLGFVGPFLRSRQSVETKK